jgi:hypothetical protein
MHAKIRFRQLLLASRFFSRLRSFASGSCALASIRFAQLIAIAALSRAGKEPSQRQTNIIAGYAISVMFPRPIYRFCLHHNCRNAVIRPVSNGRDHTVSPEPNTAVGHRCFREGRETAAVRKGKSERLSEFGICGTTENSI